MPISGRDLRSERRAAEITVTDLAQRVGIARQNLHIWEKADVLTVEQVARYRRALNDAIEASRARVA